MVGLRAYESECMGSRCGSLWAGVKCSSEHLSYKRYWNEGELKNTLSRKSHTTRPRPASHSNKERDGSEVAAARRGPRGLIRDFKTPNQPWKSGKSVVLAKHSTFPSSNWEHLPSSFSAPAFLSMQKFAVFNASRMAALAAAGKVVSFFYIRFFSPRHLFTHHLILECFPRGTGCCALICYCETRFAISSCLHIHLADSLHYCPCCDTS